ncbi:MAG: VWA domain-containing protein [Anaerolineae bacterium]|nr:VWA domain-containing protein [Anaerolineae bacterium]
MQGSIPERRSAFASALRWATRRSRSGQSIILVAFAMVALIAFVGIATDVALLFVRYNSLRRAVDSASIAVAGQVRTGVDFAKLNNVARQFVQLQGGVDPDTVLVETCETDIHNYKMDYIADFGNLPDYPSSPDPDAVKLNPDGTTSPADSFQPNIDIILGKSRLFTAHPDRPKSELCKLDPQKLVRVSAQMSSPTAFLGILGWRNVVLVAASVSQTAVLDVALVIDISPSMSEDTQSEEAKYCLQGDGCKTGVYARPAPRYTVSSPPAGTSPTDAYNNLINNTNFARLQDFKPLTADPMLGEPSPDGITATGGPTVYGLGLESAPTPSLTNWTSVQPYPNVKSIRTECIAELNYLKDSVLRGELPNVGLPDSISGTSAANYGWGGCCNDPTIQSNPTDPSYFSGTDIAAYPAGTPADGDAKNQTELAFNAKVNPDYYVYDNGNMVESEIAVNGTYYRANGTYTGSAAEVLRSYDTNDMRAMANGDGNFSDLICQPFKQVRDAARRFIKRLDFVRGDRLMLITFYGNPQVVYPTYDANAYVNSPDPFIYDKDDAVRTLNFRVGIVYNWDPPTNPGITASAGWQIGCRAWQGENNPARVFTYWSVAQCPDTNTGGGIYMSRSMFSIYGRRDAVWVMVLLSDGEANRTPSLPRTGDAPTTLGTMVGRPDGELYRDWLEVPDTWRPNTYASIPGELDKYCTNIFNETPPTSTDYSCVPNDPGAEALFGPDDPVTSVNETVERCFKYGSRPELCSAWYRDTTGATERYSYGFCPWATFCNSAATTPDGLNLDPVKVKAECFYGGNAQVTPSNPYGYVIAGTPWTSFAGVDEAPAWNVFQQESGTFPANPVCSDNDPDSRHFCSNAQGYINAYYNKYVPDLSTPIQGDVIPDYGSGASYCSPQYDADDYARDQADWAGLISYTDTVPGDSIAMFTIFFSKKKPDGNERALGQYILGVKLMRYISDAGDNGRIDNNLQEWYRYFRGQQDATTGTMYAYGMGQGVLYTKSGYPYAHYMSGNSIYSIYSGSSWMNPEQDPCSEFDYNEYALAGGFRTVYPDGTVTNDYEKIAREDCGQYWFANDISKVNRAFTEIAGRLFTRLAR